MNNLPSEICINIWFLRYINSSDLLTYSALILAYIAYVWTINRDLQSWKSLFKSFKNDLDTHDPWLNNEYHESTYFNLDKHSYSPDKIILPLSIPSLSEIIKKGVDEFSWIPEDFVKKLSIFNERILAFNSLLENIKILSSVNPIKSEKLSIKLNKIGLNDNSININNFLINMDKSLKKNEMHLAKRVHKLNKAIHVDLIGNRNDTGRLHFLHKEMQKTTKKIIKDFDKKQPFFIKYHRIILILSLIIFIIIEYLFHIS